MFIMILIRIWVFGHAIHVAACRSCQCTDFLAPEGRYPFVSTLRSLYLVCFSSRCKSQYLDTFGSMFRLQTPYTSSATMEVSVYVWPNSTLDAILIEPCSQLVTTHRVLRLMISIASFLLCRSNLECPAQSTNLPATQRAFRELNT
jgi:hypothetical protein